MGEKQYLSLGEAAKRLGTTTGTMRARVLRGQIPAEKDSAGDWRIAERHVRQILGWGNPFGTVMRYLKNRGESPLSLYR